MVVRAFQQQDFEKLGQFDRQSTQSQLPGLTELGNNTHLSGTLVLEHQKELLGKATYMQSPRPAGKYWVYVQVHNHAVEHQVLRHFYQGIIENLWPLSASMIFTMAPQEQPNYASALEDLGFRAEMEHFSARLDISKVALSRFEVYQARLKNHFEISTLRRLQAVPHINSKLYEVYRAVQPDMPELGYQQSYDFSSFKRNTLDAVGSNPKSFFIAMAENNIVGFSQHFIRNNTMEMGLTMVLPEHRRRGLAMLMKLRGVDYALANHIPGITTTMASNNIPMFTLNTRLGFKRSLGYTTYVKLL